MYGNYNSKEEVSHLRLSSGKDELRSKFNGELQARPLLDMPYVEAGIPRHLLVTMAQPTVGPWGCHACSFLIGAAVFSRVDNRWSLGAHRFALSDAGEFSETPVATLQLLGPDHFGFRLEDAVSGFGSGTSFSIFEISGGEIKEVLSGMKNSNFMQEHCWPMPLSQAWAACVEYTEGISVEPGADPAHYDIIVTRHVTGSVTARIPKGTYLFRYQYVAGKVRSQRMISQRTSYISLQFSCQIPFHG
jgi:hypothetical protein